MFCIKNISFFQYPIGILLGKGFFFGVLQQFFYSISIVMLNIGFRLCLESFVVAMWKL